MWQLLYLTVLENEIRAGYFFRKTINKWTQALTWKQLSSRFINYRAVIAIFYEKCNCPTCTAILGLHPSCYPMSIYVCADPRWRQFPRKIEQLGGPSRILSLCENHGVWQYREQGVLRERFELCAGGSWHLSCGCQTRVRTMLQIIFKCKLALVEWPVVCWHFAVHGFASIMPVRDAC